MSELNANRRAECVAKVDGALQRCDLGVCPKTLNTQLLSFMSEYMDKIETYGILRRDTALGDDSRGFHANSTYATHRKATVVNKMEICGMSIVGTIHAHRRLQRSCKLAGRA